jgi:phosphoribosyl-AMP cyclohydrolase
MNLDDLRFDDGGLIPAIVQDADDDAVLMVAYMSRESLSRTFAEGRTVFWSRSRRELWRKGETSGHVQRVEEVLADCDGDALLVRVRQTGPACHTGERTCFFETVEG